MFLSKLRVGRRFTRTLNHQRTLCDSQDHGKSTKDAEIKKEDNPLKKVFQVIGGDFKRAANFVISSTSKNNKESSQASDEEFQTHCDVLIIGGGGIGSSVAYWLKKRGLHGLNVVVVEKDSTYTRSSTCLSVGGLRQQFSLEENIQMSLYGADFMQNVKEHLDELVELNFTPHGYLMLATEEGAETLEQNSALQNKLGAKNEVLTATQMNRKFPWLNTDGIALGCHGLEKEGWFDPYALLMGFKRKAKRLGAHYIDGEVVDFQFSVKPDIMMQGIDHGTYERLDKVSVKMANNETRTINFAMCVLAAGAQSGAVAKLMRIGNGPGMLSIPLPVEPRKRYVYVVETQGANCPGLNTPLTIDPTHTYFRRDGLGGHFLCGRSPTIDKEPHCNDMEVDYEYFDSEVWPMLAKRVPAFESLRVKNAWSGFYEYNKFDQNGIIGQHPYYPNLFIATGFSGHGIQKTPAVGRAVAELIIDGDYRSIDLSRLSFDRIIVDQPMLEVGVV